jgi:hypothetical protein
MGVFHPANDHDGSGQELLTKNLDVVHLDPYPVKARGYSDVIPRDMSYSAGLARRYDRLLIPWMQAHTYSPGKLEHVSPEHVSRMIEEQRAHGVDAIMWLGWGRNYTFPRIQPDSWEKAVQLQKQLKTFPPRKPRVRLAALRPYRTWATCSRCDDQIRNPADWLLQQFLEVWAVKYKQPYDMFEVPPGMDEGRRTELDTSLKRYPLIVSTEQRKNAWVIGRETMGKTVDPETASDVRRDFEREMIRRGWLQSASKGSTVP